MEDGNEYLLEEAIALVGAASAARIDMRLLGGLAVRARSAASRRAPWSRVCGDCDFYARAKQSAVEAVFVSRGWRADAEFNLYNGDSRLSFHSPSGEKKADVFLNAFSMCHDIPLAPRSASGGATLPVHELLLTKLQVVETNDKDFRDVACLLLDHEIGGDGDASIDAASFAAACSGDWGLWKTVGLGLERFRAWLPGSGASAQEEAAARAKAAALTDALEASPKSIGWKARALVGERVKWYRLPEEAER